MTGLPTPVNDDSPSFAMLVHRTAAAPKEGVGLKRHKASMNTIGVDFLMLTA